MPTRLDLIPIWTVGTRTSPKTERTVREATQLTSNGRAPPTTAVIVGRSGRASPSPTTRPAAGDDADDLGDPKQPGNGDPDEQGQHPEEQQADAGADVDVDADRPANDLVTNPIKDLVQQHRRPHRAQTQVHG